MTAVPPTLCIGVDVTWWGGSPRNRKTQLETIVSARLDNPDSFAIETVDLHGAPNPRRSERTESNFDRDGEVLLGPLGRIIRRHSTAHRVLVALDAPLEARARPHQPPRRRAVGKGEKAGSERRECERHLQQHMRDLLPPVRKAWNPGLKIQSGSPVPPRIAAIVDALRETGFQAYRSGTPQSRTLLEVFPSEAIWSLGAAGHYGSCGPTEVRAYKAKKPSALTADEALHAARAPLLGFVPVLARTELGSTLVERWVETLSRHACDVAIRRDGRVGKGKRFDDVIDSGAAFLTAVAFAMGEAHVWGDGSDGAIAGPGRLTGVSGPGPC